MDADFNDTGKPELLAHEQTYHGFSVLLRWCMLGLATVIPTLILWFATSAGFWGGLIAGIFGGWRAARLRPAAALAKVA